MKETICRAVTFPMMPLDGDWLALDLLLYDCWAESTALANWAVLELAKADVVRTPSMEKLPSMNKVELYKLFQKYENRQVWVGATQAAACVLRAVQRKYMQERFNVLWRRNQALCTYRYPYPFPLHNQSWSCSWGKDRVPLVTVSLPSRKVELRLRGGSEMRRQLAMFSQLVDGRAKCGEAAIYRKGDHTMFKMTGHFTKRPAGELSGTMLVRTDPNAFWVAEQEEHAPWILNSDHIRRWIAEHTVYRQRMSEDLKYEKRWPSEVRRHMLQSLDDRCRKQRDRLNTWCHQASKMLAEYAKRQRVEAVIYDDANQVYLPKFPWSVLREMVENKLDERGIKLIAAVVPKVVAASVDVEKPDLVTVGSNGHNGTHYLTPTKVKKTGKRAK